MRSDDTQLIQRVLSGDDTAFTELVKKYQKPVHALVWRKVGDFHVAEEITQDTFLKAYQKLTTLKEPQSFASWLYVIATRHCIAWLRKKRLWTQSLEATNSLQFEKATYSGYVVEENERTAIEAEREVVKKLLAKLQESERTVMTLHYFGGMTCEEISKFLGVSVGAIKSRLSRARHRLKKEEPMIREALENFQITPNLTENIMREVSRLKPITPSGSKPLVPWAVGVSTLAVILLMLGVGSQYLSRFQKPYSFDATSEMTVDIIETAVVLDIKSEPDIRTQLGNSAAPNKNGGAGQRPDEVLFAAAQADGEDVPVPKQQWIQGSSLGDTSAETLLTTPEGEIYVIDGYGAIYKSSHEATAWQYVNNIKSLSDNWWDGKTLMAKWNDTLYMIVSNILFSSTDDGKTWISVSNRPSGGVAGLVVMDGVFYLAHGYSVYRSTDAGKTWMPVGDAMEEQIRTLRIIRDTLFATTTTGVYRLDDGQTWIAVNDGLAGEIHILSVVQNTLFAATTADFYRLDVDRWHPLQFPVPEAEIMGSLAWTDSTLYVMAQLHWDKLDDDTLRQMDRGQKRSWWIFRSTDKGESWTDITPTNAWPVQGHAPFVELAAVGKTVLVIGSSDGGVVRSIDSGDTWTREENTGISMSMGYSVSSVVALNGSTFLSYGDSGMHRSIDGGKSWERFNPGSGSFVKDLISFGTDSGANAPTQLYATTGTGLVKSNDNGKTWHAVNPEIQITEFYRENPPQILEVLASDGVVYAKGKVNNEARLSRVSKDGNTLIQMSEIPIFHSRGLWNLLSQRRELSSDLEGKSFVKQLQESTSGATQFFKQFAEGDAQSSGLLIHGGLGGTFAVSNDTFYMEYNYKLFRWKPGDTQWYDTEMEEVAEISRDKMMRGFKLAVSENTVYVGKRDGHLVVSFDEGNNWMDLTPALPFPVKDFNDIVFSGSTVYVATDAGVTTPDNGKDWRAITDATGMSLAMARLAVDGTNVYGISGTGIYRLQKDTGSWDRITPEIPETPNSGTSFDIDGNVLYVGTNGSGVFHFNLDEL